MNNLQPDLDEATQSREIDVNLTADLQQRHDAQINDVVKNMVDQVTLIDT